MRWYLFLVLSIILTGCISEPTNLNEPTEPSGITTPTGYIYERIQWVRIDGQDVYVEKVVDSNGVQFTLELMLFNDNGNFYELDALSLEYRVLIGESVYYGFDVVNEGVITFDYFKILDIPIRESQIKIEVPTYEVINIFELRGERYVVEVLRNPYTVATYTQTYTHRGIKYDILGFPGEYRITHNDKIYYDFNIVKRHIISINEFKYSKIPLFEIILEESWPIFRSEYPELDDVYMITKENSYEEGTTEIEVTITNEENNKYTYGQDFTLQKFVGDDWRIARRDDGIEMVFYDIGYTLPEYSGISVFYELNPFSLGLLPGEYRIGTTIVRETVNGEYETSNYATRTFQLFAYFEVE